MSLTITRRPNIQASLSKRFPPGRGHNDPIDVAHTDAELITRVMSRRDDPDSAVAFFCNFFNEIVDLLEIDFGRIVAIAAVDDERNPAFGNAALLQQNAQSLQNDVDTLVVDELAEKAKAVIITAVTIVLGSRRGMSLPVRRDVTPLGVQPPLLVAIGKKIRWKDVIISVALVENRLEPLGS